MSELTAADLARLDHLTEYATAGPWEPWYSALNECWNAGQPGRTGLVVANCIDEDAANFIAASRAAVPALVAAVRELARALDRLSAVAGVRECPCCGRLAWDERGHAESCPVLRARALLGDR